MISSLDNLKNFIKDEKFNKIFLLCGKTSFITSGAKIFINNCLDKNKHKIFFKESEIPRLDELIKIIKEVRKFKPDLILAIGGGTIIDYAKIANVVEIKDDLASLIKNYSYPFKEKFSKLAVIPTTAGSGAEVTSNAVIYIDNIKYSFESDKLIPDFFFLFPNF